MGKAKPVTLGHLHFAKQGGALEYFKEILNRYSPGDAIDAADYADVEALLSGHPRAEEKIGGGVASLLVDRDEDGGQCFHVLRTDGTKENFSYKKCIAGDPEPFTAFSAACRRVVDAELDAFKRAYFDKHQNLDGKVKCPETNRRVKWDEAHVDHKSPHSFSVIVKFFINSQGINLSHVVYNRAGLYGHELADAPLAAAFQSWHKKNAVLRVIDGGRNLAKASLARIKLTKDDHTL
jgi:hypothetical protein